MKTEDNRTEEQKKTHTLAVVARDKFISGWGGASGGMSRCAWACEDREQLDALERWVRTRSEMIHVNLVDLSTYRAPRGTAHFHIYVADPQYHPALAHLHAA